jgi:hypothetical protein
MSYARPRHARVLVFGMLAYMCPWMYMTSYSAVCIGSRIVSYASALYSSLTHVCVQPWVELHRRGGSAAHCCSTCSQLHTPRTRVSAVHSLLVGVVGTFVHCIYYCVVHWNGGRHTCKLCTRACIWYVCMHVCMGVSRIVSYARALRTRPVSVFSDTHVHTAFRETP